MGIMETESFSEGRYRRSKCAYHAVSGLLPCSVKNELITLNINAGPLNT